MKNILYLSLGIMLSQAPSPLWSQVAAVKAVADTTTTAQRLIHIKNNTQTAAVATVRAQDLRSSEANPAHALFGKISGLTVLQKDQVAWSNNPQFYIRGVGSLNNNTPLVLVDGYERELSLLTMEEIASVTVLKDAATLSLYGVRGANGVIDVQTKRGMASTLEVKVNLQTGIKNPFRLPKFADSYNYALALNEALTLDGLTPTYSQNAIEGFRKGNQPELYPTVDWLGETMRKQGSDRELTASFRGGDERIKYYSVINYVGDEGLLKQTDLNPDYDAQLIWDRLNLRTNLDAKLTESTQVRLNLLGQIARHNRPSVNYPALFSSWYDTPPAVFPVKTTTGNWGGNRLHLNPLAEMTDRGYVTGNDRTLFADLALDQNLSSWIPGLGAEASVAFDNRAAYWDGRNKTYISESLIPVLDQNGEVSSVNRAVYGQNSALNFSSELGIATMLKAVDGKIKYETVGNNRYQIHSYAMYRMEEYAQNGRNNTVRRQSILGNVNYALDDKYVVDIAASYSGSSVMTKSNRFALFPSLSAAWIISKEDFMQDQSVVDQLKIRASYGLTGSDRFAYELDRQYFMIGGSSYFFHANNKTYSGIKEGALRNNDLQYEKSYKSNVGIDATLWKNLNFSADIFYDKRKNILVSADGIYSSVLGIGMAQLNEGEVDNKGLEMDFSWQQQIGDWHYRLGGNFAFSRSKIMNMNEGYQPESYLKREGRRVGQYFGLESIGYFTDEADINNSPAQRFSETKPGDLKYKDQNGDQLINEYDEVALGYSTIAPEIYYGFQFGVGFKGLQLNAQFQGVANYSVVKNMNSYYWPLKNNTTVSTHYLENRWTPDHMDALYPRLTTLDNKNNFRNNSTWLANGAFLKLRNVDLTYTLPQHWSEQIKAKKIGLLVRGTNLISWDHIGTLDPEMMYATYPSFRSYHFGVNLTF